MNDLKTPVRAVPVTEAVLRELSCRGLEDRDRQDALSRAEQAGRLAAAAGLGRQDPSEEDVARFEAQMRRIGECVVTMPSMGTLLRREGTLRSESRRFAASIRSAERLERRTDA